MTYTIKNFQHLLGIPGLSDDALNTHFKLYEGYVTNTNKILGSLEKMITEGKKASPEFAELKRRFGWEFNGMRLHEYYFANLSKEPKKMNTKSALVKKIAEDFGNFENWLKDFKTTASMRGIGWVILYFDQQAKRLLNVWINEHDAGHPAGLTPLIVCDMFEHAFIIDYRTKKPDYIEAFTKALAWNEVENRFEKAI